MSFLSSVSTGIKQEGQRIVIAAIEGAGKTTLIADAPRSLFIPIEDGYQSIRTAKTDPIKSWSDLIILMNEIRAACQAKRFPYQTLSFDSATALERHAQYQVVLDDPKVKSGANKYPVFAELHGGYGKAYDLLREKFQELLNRFDELKRYAGLNIVLSCHTFSTLVKDAAFGEYNSWDLNLYSPKNEKTYGPRELITQWADCVGFLHEPLFVSKADGATISRGINAGQGRMLAIERSPGWVAKNRYGIVGPASIIPIPAPKPIGPGGGWNNFAHSVYNASGIDIFNRD